MIFPENCRGVKRSTIFLSNRNDRTQQNNRLIPQNRKKRKKIRKLPILQFLFFRRYAGLIGKAALEAIYTVAGIGVRLRPCANALRCKACQVQPQHFKPDSV